MVIIPPRIPQKLTTSTLHTDSISGAIDPYTLKWFIYGPNGVGKTRLAGTLANLDRGPILFIDTEGGTTSIRTLHPEHIKVFKFRTYRDYEQIIDLLARPHDVIEQYPGGVILDTISGARDIISDHVLDLVKGRGASEDKAKHDSELLEMRDWGRTAKRSRKLSALLRDLPLPVAVTCQQAVERNTLGQIIGIGPRLSDSLLGLIPGDFDVVGYIDVEIRMKEVYRVIQFQPTPLLMAKDRTDLLGDKVRGGADGGPTLPQLIKKMEEQLHHDNRKT